MFYLQKGLEGVLDILDFYVTPYTLEPGGKTEGIVAGWDDVGVRENSILVPSSMPCRVQCVKITGRVGNALSSLKFGRELSGGLALKEEVRLPLSFHRMEVSGEHTVLAEIDAGGKKSPAIVLLGDNTVLFAFDPGAAVKTLLLYEYLAGKSSTGLLTAVNSVGAALATRMPLGLRNYLIKTYLKLARKASKDSGFPAWPMDNSSDVLREVFLKTMAMVSDTKEVQFIAPWPEGGSFCFCSTHDVDTTGGFGNIPFVRRTEETFKVPSTWFVTHEINPDVSFLKNLEADGCEVGSHGWLHDDRLGLIPAAEAEERFRKSAEQFKGITLTGFRAPYNGFHPGLFGMMKKYVSYDSSAQEARIYASVRAHRLGCCTLFPYEVNGLTELPSTMPPDYLLINTLGYDPEKVYDLWEKELSCIKLAGGMALMQTHPEEFDIGNDRFIEPYRKVLEKVSGMDDCFVGTAADVASWWKARASCTIEAEGGRPMLKTGTNTPAVLMKMRMKEKGFVVDRA